MLSDQARQSLLRSDIEEGMPISRRRFIAFPLLTCRPMVDLAIGAAAGKTQPNILFMMTDDHASQAMSCYGSRVNQTPNLDRIAKEGIRMDNVFATNSICTPSRATEDRSGSRKSCSTTSKRFSLLRQTRESL
jgi:hypothetical protein